MKYKTSKPIQLYLQDVFVSRPKINSYTISLEMEVKYIKYFVKSYDIN